MKTLTRERKAQIVRCIVEGSSVRATSRITGTSKGAILKLLEEIGQACLEYQQDTLKNLPCRRIQCDEIWQFCYAKKRNVPQALRNTFGYG